MQIGAVIDVDTFNSSLLTQVLWWAKFFNHSLGANIGNDGHINSSWVSQLMLDVSKVARKEGNFVLAEKILVEYLKSEDGLLTLDAGTGMNRKVILEEVVQSLIDTTVTGKEPNLSISMVWNVQNARALTEVAKVLYRYVGEFHSSTISPVC